MGWSGVENKQNLIQTGTHTHTYSHECIYVLMETGTNYVIFIHSLSQFILVR